MAKRKKSSKRKSSKRRVSGIGNASLIPIIAVAGGALGAKFISEKIAAQAPDIKPNMLLLGQGIVGFLLTRAKNPMLSAAGLGFIGNAAIEAAKSFGIVSGIGSNLVTFSAKPQGLLNGMENVLAGNNENDYSEDSDTMGDLAILAGTVM